MSAENVTRLIPHRPPFLFVDAVESLSATEAVTRKTWEPAEAFYAGHYPGNPITPGVLLCEAVFQTGAILLAHRMEGAGSSLADKVPVLTRIEEARFRAMVRPGETVTIRCTLTEERGQFVFLKGRVDNAKGRAVLLLNFILAGVAAGEGGEG